MAETGDRSESNGSGEPGLDEREMEERRREEAAELRREQADDTQGDKKCPQCSEPVEDLRVTCPNCGYEYQEGDYTDPEAGTEFRAGAAVDNEEEWTEGS